MGMCDVDVDVDVDCAEMRARELFMEMDGWMGEWTWVREGRERRGKERHVNRRDSGCGIDLETNELTINYPACAIFKFCSLALSLLSRLSFSQNLSLWVISLR